MRVDILMDDGTPVSYDTDKHTAASAVAIESPGPVGFKLLLDDAHLSTGLWMESLYFDSARPKKVEGMRLQTASKAERITFQLLARSELDHAVRVSCDGAVVLQRCVLEAKPVEGEQMPEQGRFECLVNTSREEAAASQLSCADGIVNDRDPMRPENVATRWAAAHGAGNPLLDPADMTDAQAEEALRTASAIGWDAAVLGRAVRQRDAFLAAQSEEQPEGGADEEDGAGDAELDDLAEWLEAGA